MKTEKIVVTSQGQGIADALTLTEKAGVYAGLDKKPALHLRLLAEELIGLLRGIAGEVEAEYWIETEGKKFELHMTSEIRVTEQMREQFLAASSSGKNAAAATFMGKIRVMIADTVLSAKEVLPYAMINAAAANPLGGVAGESASVWTMALYKEELQKNMDDEEASEAWDELEKSIVANVADDVRVSIAGKNVAITVYKAF